MSSTPSYRNGFIPEDLLVRFKSGWNATDGEWHHSLSPATYARHRALVARAWDRTGKTLAISLGWSAYRPYAAQVLAQKIHKNYAAEPGTSSHGGFWEGRQTLAMDYGNWASVYSAHGGQAAFFEDCRAVGLSPGLIMRTRGYPDEPWHVVDLNPWSAAPAGLGVSELKIEKEDDMKLIQADGRGFALVGAGYYRSLPAGEGAAISKVIAAVGVSAADFDQIRSACTSGDVNYMPPVRTPNVATDVWAHQVNGMGNGHAANYLTQVRAGVLALTAAPGAGVDGVKLAADLASSLAPLLVEHLGGLDDEDIARLVKATADESDRRARERLA